MLNKACFDEKKEAFVTRAFSFFAVAWQPSFYRDLLDDSQYSFYEKKIQICHPNKEGIFGNMRSKSLEK
jgi:hypothetical protein